MITFKEYMEQQNNKLFEAIAMYGDWEPYKDRVQNKSDIVVKKDYKEIDKITTPDGIYELLIMKMNNKESYMIGNWIITPDGLKFTVLLNIDLSIRDDIKAKFNFKKQVLNVDGVMVHESHRGTGIAKYFYAYLIKRLDKIIIGDEYQYFGARKLWARLSKLSNVTVDIINVETNKYIKKNVEILHGDEDHEFDDEIYSYDNSKKDIRLILKDIE